MLNETASSTDDQPSARSSARLVTGEDDGLRQELREMVAGVFDIERESDQSNPALVGGEQILVMSRDTELVATFEGQLRMDSEAAYERLDRQMKPTNHLPLFRTHGDKQVIHVLRGRVTPKPRAVWVNIALFVATVFSVLMLGTQMAINEIASSDLQRAAGLMNNFFLELWRGLPYAVSILLILGAHELGHYFAARHHKIAVTLPYFIPAPFIGFLGTFGAFIQLREPMRNRKVLLDVGAAGPLTGLIFAIPILFIGLATSRVGPITPGGLLEGNSLLYALAKTLVFGRFLPDGAVDVYINQLAMAGWAGLLVTALNLIPLGQLDGGHILYSLIGERARKLYFPLLIAAGALAFLSSAWVLWVLLLLFFGRVYATPLDTITPLNRRRRWIALLSLLIFVVIFVPVPLSEVNITTVPAPRNSVFLLPMLTAVGVVVMQRLRR